MLALDILMCAALLAVFYGGFKVGNSFKSLKDAAAALVERIF